MSSILVFLAREEVIGGLMLGVVVVSFLALFLCKRSQDF